MKFGIDRLIAEPALRAPLRGRRVALLAHPASVTPELIHSLDALAGCGDIKITAAFGPQHGLRGDKQDNMIESPDFIDPVHGIPIFSLYSQVRKPTDPMMDTCDVILVDLQDLGCRIYTFITTLRYVLEGASKHHKAVWVLDRPNPVGRPVEGLTLRAGWRRISCPRGRRNGSGGRSAWTWLCPQLRGRRLNIRTRCIWRWLTATGTRSPSSIRCLAASVAAFTQGRAVSFCTIAAIVFASVRVTPMRLHPENARCTRSFLR